MPRRTAIVTMSSIEIADYASLTIPLMAAYAQKHQYIFEAGRVTKQPTRGITFQKLALIALRLRTLPPNSLLAWFDPDVIVTRHDLPLETLVPPYFSPYASIFLAADQNGMNAGAMLIRNTAAAAAAFAAAYNRTDADDHPHADQEALRRELTKTPEIVHYLPRHRLQSYPAEWTPQSFSCHYANHPSKAVAIRYHLYYGHPISAQ